MITIFYCTYFDKKIADAEIHVGDAIRYEIAEGPLHEICLIDNLEMPNLDQETVTEN